MTFLNTFILAGLAAVSIPIIIHLFNRRKAKVVDWGAMQFLLDSLIHRKRRVLIEEAILMALRCLLLAALVLAIARPFSPVQPGISWLLMLPLVLLSAVLLAVTTILARNRRWRWFLYAAGALVAVAVVMGTYAERLLQLEKWKGGAEQDVAIIIDGSDSMRLEIGGVSNFKRAIDQARMLMAALGEEDHVTVIVAGSTPHVVTPQPVSARSDILEKLDELEPVGGTMQVVDATVAAVNSLSRGDHAAKKLVILSDRHRFGWETENLQRWQFVASVLNKLPTPPRLVTRFLDLPRTYRNVAIHNLQLSRTLIGRDRPVTIRVTVENTGGEELEPEGVEYRIAGGVTTTVPVGPVQPGESVEVELKHQFEKAGTYAVSVRVITNDDLEVDNETHHVIQVVPSLPVLIVDGNSGGGSGFGGTMFLQLALAPPVDISFASNEQQGEPGEAEIAAEKNPPLVEVDVVAAPDLGEGTRLDDYRVVILADVPRLGAPVADALARFVAAGGGLWIAPGRRAEADFYNQWKLPDGRLVLPARLGERKIVDPDRQFGISTENVHHAAMQKVVAEGHSDLASASVAAYWELVVDADDVRSSIGMLLENGAPMLVESDAGYGRVALSSLSVDIDDSNLPTLFSFLPLVHELTYHLAAPDLVSLNYEQQTVVRFDIPRRSTGNGGEDAEPQEPGEPNRLVADLTAPDGTLQQGTVEVQDERLVVTLVGVDQPGIYQLTLPESLERDLQGLRPVSQSAGSRPSIPLSVTRAPEESRLELLSDTDQAAIGRNIDYFAAANDRELIAAVIDEVPGHELWKYLVVAALLILLAECFVTRWIAWQRKTGAEEKVEFVSEGEKLSSFRERAQQMLETVRNP
jgi:hypothetical protein